MVPREPVAAKHDIIPTSLQQLTSHFVEYPIVVSPKVLTGFVNQALPLLALASKEGTRPYEDSIKITVWGFHVESTMQPISIWIDQPFGTRREEDLQATAPECIASELQVVFQELVTLWKTETLILSSATQIVMNESYQKIIGLGPKVLPLIFRELRREQDLWFWALRAITRVDPVPAEHAGKIKNMTADWLEWAYSKGYIA